MLSVKVTAIAQLDDKLSSPFKFITMPTPCNSLKEDNHIYIAWEMDASPYVELFETGRLKKIIVDFYDVSSDYHEVEMCDYIRFYESYKEYTLFSCEPILIANFRSISHLKDEEEWWINEYICNEKGIDMYKPEKNPPVTNGNISMPVISDIYYNDPYTTVKWFDGTITTVRASDGDKFNKEYGLAMAIAKKYYECLGVPSPRKAFKQAVYSDAHDYTEAIAKRNARKEAAKNRENNGHVSTSSESSEG